MSDETKFLIVSDQTLTSDTTFLMEKSRYNVQRHNHTEKLNCQVQVAKLQNFRRNCNRHKLENTDSGRLFNITEY